MCMYVYIDEYTSHMNVFNTIPLGITVMTVITYDYKQNVEHDSSSDSVGMMNLRRFTRRFAGGIMYITHDYKQNVENDSSADFFGLMTLRRLIRRFVGGILCCTTAF